VYVILFFIVRFDSLAAGVVTSLNPLSVNSNANAQLITIVGTNLALTSESGVTVTLHGVAATIVSINSIQVNNSYATTIIARAGDCKQLSCMGTGSIVVTSPVLGVATSVGQTFTYLYTPISITPTTFVNIGDSQCAFAQSVICDPHADIHLDGIVGMNTEVYFLVR